MLAAFGSCLSLQPILGRREIQGSPDSKLRLARIITLSRVVLTDSTFQLCQLCAYEIEKAVFLCRLDGFGRKQEYEREFSGV